MKIEELLRLGKERQTAGELDVARRLYQQVLAEEPRNAVALLRSGLLEMQEGRADAAIGLVRAAIAAKPGEANYCFILGELLTSTSRWHDAIAAYQNSIGLDPQKADVFFSLGNAQQAAGDFAEAIASYHAATRLRADFADAFGKIGACYSSLGNLEEAESTYRQALALRPRDADAMSNLGTLLGVRGEMKEAIGLLRAAVDAEPVNANHAINLGALLSDVRDFAGAVAILTRAVELSPNHADAAYNLANALAGLGRFRDAIPRYVRAIQLRRGFADAMNNLGNIYKELGEFGLASAAYEDAIRVRPGFVVAMNNAGCLLRSMGKLEEAEHMLRRAMAIDEQHPAVHNNLGNVLKDSGQLDEAISEFRQALKLQPANIDAHSNLTYALSFACEEAGPILEECRRWNAWHAVPVAAALREHNMDRSARRRLRIGYVSPDFRDHCQALFTIPLLSHHDHTRFEIFCYSNVERPDEFTARIRTYADQWRDIRAMDDAAVCEMIRVDRIDILVDLTMHMAGGRPLIFARKPAPVQIAWLAYPGTTGISTIDYRLSDPRLDPPGSEHEYTEKTIRLPDSFWCYDPLTNEPKVNDLPALSRGRVTFGCLNNPCKLTEHTLHLWGGVMDRLPASELVLMAPTGQQRDRLLARLGEQGIGEGRVRFVPYRPRGQYLRTYQEVDIGLDTFPYNGHTTSLDALWMGVPVVTRVGQTCVGRGGLSQLFQLGLTELAGETDEDFISIATQLAADLPRLVGLRRGLRARLERSALMDGERFARNIEGVYRGVFGDRII